MASPHQNNEVGWRKDVLPSKTRRALNLLSHEEWLGKEQWYLAGGTALALHEGHRASHDLDFFYPQKTFNLTRLLARLSGNQWEVDVAEEGTVFASVDGVKVSFIAYPFFVPKENPRRLGTIRVLQPEDIAVMKIIAISQRGRKRDFVDLYWHTTKRESLGQVLLRLPRQYPAVAHDYHHILKSLLYFADADQDPMPKLFFQATWPHIKKYFNKEVPKLAREILELR